MMRMGMSSSEIPAPICGSRSLPKSWPKGDSAHRAPSADSAMAAHSSLSELTCTRRSGQAACSRNSSHDITSPAWAVVVVMK
jgi:hypothetical protein